MEFNLKDQKPYLELTNILRGGAALVVLIWHYQHFYYGFEDFDFTRQPLFRLLSIPYTRGYEAVPLFWMISGVVLTHRYLGEHIPMRSFAIARIARLYPLHLATLFVVAVLQFLANAQLGYQLIYGNNDLKHFVLNLFFASSWGFENGYSFNAPIWSVSIEIPIYIAFGASLALQKLRSMPVWLFAATGLLLGSSWFREWPSQLLNQEFLRCLLYFSMGSAILQLANYWRRSQALRISLGSIAVVALVFLQQSSYDYLFLTCICVLVAALSIEGSLLQPLSRSLNWFGALTYSVFLCHIPVQMLLILAWGGYEGLSSTPDESWFMLLYVALTYGVGAIAYRFVESPARVLVQRLAASRESSQPSTKSR